MAKRKSPRVSAKTKKRAVRKAPKPKAAARPAQKPSKGKWVYGFGGAAAEAVDPFSFGRFLRRARCRLGLRGLSNGPFFGFSADARRFSFSHGSKIGGRANDP